MRKQKSQIKDIVTYLKKNGSITSMEAWTCFHATRLADVIFKLRKLGYVIDTETCDGKNEYGTYTYAKYIFVEEPENAVFSN